jgi:hypothetical protein
MEFIFEAFIVGFPTASIYYYFGKTKVLNKWILRKTPTVTALQRPKEQKDFFRKT